LKPNKLGSVHNAFDNDPLNKASED